MVRFDKIESVEVESEVTDDNQMEAYDTFIEKKLDMPVKSEHFKPYSDNVNRESSMTAMSVAMAHSVSRHSSHLQIDGSLLEMVRFVGRVTDTPSTQPNKTTFYLNDLGTTVQSVNPMLCVLWSINVDNYNKCVQLLKRQKVKVVGTLEVIESQIALTVLSVQSLFGDFDAKYHALDVEMESLKRQLNLKQLYSCATSMSHNFNPSGEIVQATKKLRIGGNVTPPTRSDVVTKFDPSLEMKKTNDQNVLIEAPSANTFAAANESEMARYAVCLANDENTQFYHKLIKDIIAEQTSSPRHAGLTNGCIAYFIEKQHFQVPSVSKIKIVLQSLLGEGCLYEISEGHFKWLL